MFKYHSMDYNILSEEDNHIKGFIDITTKASDINGTIFTITLPKSLASNMNIVYDRLSLEHGYIIERINHGNNSLSNKFRKNVSSISVI